MNTRKPTLKVAVTYSVCAATWGTTWFAIRVCIAPGGYPTYEAAAIRFSVAVLVIAALGAFGLVRLKQQTKQHVRWLTAAGIFNAVGYALVFAGEQTVPGSVAAVLFASLPLITAMVSVATRTEPISFGQVFGAVVSFLGIAIIFWDRLRVSHQQAIGVVMILFAVVSSAGYALIFKRKTRDAHSMSATLIFLASTATGLWCVSLAQGWHALPSPLPLKPTLALLYMSVFGSVIAFACYIYLMKQVSMMAVATLVMIEPVIALVIDHLWEHQVRLEVRSYIGSGVTLLGLLVSLLIKPGQQLSAVSTGVAESRERRAES